MKNDEINKKTHKSKFFYNLCVSIKILSKFYF